MGEWVYGRQPISQNDGRLSSADEIDKLQSDSLNGWGQIQTLANERPVEDRDQFDEVFRIFGACIAADQPDLECRGVRFVGIPAGIAHIERSGDLLEVGGIGLGLVEDVPELVVDRLEVVRAGVDRGYLQGDRKSVV